MRAQIQILLFISGLMLSGLAHAQCAATGTSICQAEYQQLKTLGLEIPSFEITRINHDGCFIDECNEKKKSFFQFLIANQENWKNSPVKKLKREDGEKTSLHYEAGKESIFYDHQITPEGDFGSSPLFQLLSTTTVESLRLLRARSEAAVSTLFKNNFLAVHSGWNSDADLRYGNAYIEILELLAKHAVLLSSNHVRMVSLDKLDFAPRLAISNSTADVHQLSIPADTNVSQLNDFIKKLKMQAHYGDNGIQALGDFERDTNGQILELNKPQAIARCKAKGMRLPDLQDLIRFARHYGAKGTSPSAYAGKSVYTDGVRTEMKLMRNQGYQLISSQGKVLYYYSNRGYISPSGDLSRNFVWSTNSTIGIWNLYSDRKEVWNETVPYDLRGMGFDGGTGSLNVTLSFEQHNSSEKGLGTICVK